MSEGKRAAFTEWLQRSGAYVSPKLDLFGAGAGGDRTVRTLEDVEEGERLLLVPEPSTITLGASGPSAAESRLAAAAYLSEAHPTLSPFIRTVLLLMAEMARGEESPWHAYIATLPESTDCLLTWPPADRKLLDGTSIAERGRSPEAIFESDIAPLLAACPALFGGPSPGYAAFRRAAELVQTRAFHMNEENWVTGASRDEVEQLYLIPGMDMLNHSTLAERRNTTLERIKSPMRVEVEGVGAVTFDAFFTMKAERAIPAGEEVLHTYGDLSDAQLLLTYGFLEPLPAPNPHNYALIPYKALVAAAAAALGAEEAAAVAAGALLEQKEALLVSGGVLQRAAPRETEFVATGAEPLGEEMLTAAQVLLMTAEEFEQLREEQETQAKAANGDAGASTSNGVGGQQQQQQRLPLGRALLTGDFGEMVAATVLQACNSVLKGYPQPADPDAMPPGSHAASAARVAEGERWVLNKVRRAAVMIMAEAGAKEDGTEDDSGDETGDTGAADDDSSGSEEEEGGESEEGEEEEEAAAAAAAAEEAAAGRGKRRAGLGFTGSGGGGKKTKRGGGGGGGDGRPHFGDLTGPKEDEVLESEDSDDKVGYGPDGPHTRDRHPVMPGDEHKYEVAADGHAREVHGEMLGPDEEAAIYSEDSDKVGYA